MMTLRWKFLAVCIAFFFYTTFLVAQGQLTPVPKQTPYISGVNSPYGYFEYLPAGYSSTSSTKWPVVLFLHGVGEAGDGVGQLSIIENTGLPMLMKKGKQLPFVVIMPQSPSGWWDSGTVDQLVEFIKTKYQIDQSRFYLTGLSAGAIGSWQYVSLYPQKIAAMVAISGNNGGTNVCNLTTVPIWDFHGDNDGTVAFSGDLTAITAINSICSPLPNPRAKLTVYPGVGHNCWDRTYDDSGMGTERKDYDPFNMDIFTWFLQYSKGIVPISVQANAGPDKSITLPANSLTLSGTGTSNKGSISTYAWTKINGPAATLSGQNTNTLNLTGLVEGVYTVELKVTDVAGNSALDDVVITVLKAPVNGNNLVGEWSLDNNATDKSGNSINGTLVNNPSFTTDHEEGTAAISFNGTNQYVDLKNPSLLPSGNSPRTLSLWAKASDISPGYRWAASFGSPSYSNAMFIGQYGTSLYGGSYSNDLIVNNFWTANVWHHLCLTYDGTTARLYADGVQVSSAAKSWNLILANAYIGRQVNNAEYWNGVVDDVRIYNKALSATEVQALAQPSQPISVPSLVGEWSLDNNASDKSGNSINGTLVNSPSFTTDHKEGTAAISFNGTNQYVDLKNPALLPSGNSPRTLSLWAKANNISPGYRWAASFGSPSYSNAMFIGQNGTSLFGGSYANDLIVNNFWAANVWHHLCLTYDGTTARLYADGVQVSSAAKSWNLILANAYIGRQVNNAEYWNGVVDDVRIYRKALSPAEIQTLLQNGSVVRVAEAEAEVNETSNDDAFYSYPNPVQRFISFHLSAGILEVGDYAMITLQDLNGKEVKKIENINQESSPVEVDMLPDGMYIASLVVRGRIVARKRFIKTSYSN